jgi:hypothetical protein
VRFRRKFLFNSLPPCRSTAARAREAGTSNCSPAICATPFFGGGKLATYRGASVSLRDTHGMPLANCPPLATTTDPWPSVAFQPRRLYRHASRGLLPPVGGKRLLATWRPVMVQFGL